MLESRLDGIQAFKQDSATDMMRLRNQVDA